MLELLLTLLVLYALQCAVLLPRGATLFVRLAGRWRLGEGPGWRCLHPWPSAWSWLAARPALTGSDGALRARGFTPALGAGFALGEGPRIRPGGGQAVAVRGSRVCVDGVPALRGLDPGHAAALGALLERLAAPGAEADAILEERARESLCWEAFEERRGRAAAATRWLAGLSDAYGLLLFAALPALAAWLGGERALLVFAPACGALHLAALAALARALTRLRGDVAAGRFEMLFTAALYPPLLLRAAQELRRRALAGFHPALVAAALLPRDDALAFLRGELARGPAPWERDALEALLARLGTTRAALFAPPERCDPRARSYCPACRVEYLVAAGACSDCAVSLSPLA